MPQMRVLPSDCWPVSPTQYALVATASTSASVFVTGVDLLSVNISLADDMLREREAFPEPPKAYEGAARGRYFGKPKYFASFGVSPLTFDEFLLWIRVPSGFELSVTLGGATSDRVVSCAFRP